LLVTVMVELPSRKSLSFVPQYFHALNTDVELSSREFVASYPAGVMAVRLSASQAGALKVKCSLSRTNWVTDQHATISSNIVGSNTVILKANSGQSSGAITFTSEARVVTNGGKSLRSPRAEERKALASNSTQ
jgi:hypothetical protein